MKKILSIAMAVCVIFAMVSCGGGSGSSGSTNVYTVSYNANGWTGGGLPPNTTVPKGDRIGADAIPALDETSTQKWLGWSLTAGQTGERVRADYVPTGNIILYVLWQELVEEGGEVTITYDANGWTGTGVPQPTTGVSGEAIGEENLPVLTDTETQVFLGWSLTSGKGGNKVSATTRLAGHTTLYVLWVEPVYLSFDYNFTTTEPNPETVMVGKREAVGDALPVVEADPYTEEALIYPGYMFLGWFTEATGGDKVTETTTFSEDTTLYAQWEYLPEWVFFELNLQWIPYTQGMAGTQWPPELPTVAYDQDGTLHWGFTLNTQRGLILLSPGQRKLMEIPELEGFRMWIDGEVAESQAGTNADQ